MAGRSTLRNPNDLELSELFAEARSYLVFLLALTSCLLWLPVICWQSLFSHLSFFALTNESKRVLKKELENLAVAVVTQKVGEVLSDAVERFRENAKLR